LLPLGQIEVKNLHDAKEIEDAILVPRKAIQQLNNKIKALLNYLLCGFKVETFPKLTGCGRSKNDCSRKICPV